MKKGVLILGCGFIGKVLAQKLAFKGIPVVGTAQTAQDLSVIRTRGAAALPLDGDASAIDTRPLQAQQVVMAIPPSAGLDEALVSRIKGWGLAPGQALYLSDVAVYGDRGGATVDEESEVRPENPEAEAYLQAEAVWQGIGASVLRLGEVYGPKRSPLRELASRTARPLESAPLKSWVHVDDVVTMIEAALSLGQSGVYLGVDAQPNSALALYTQLSAHFELPPAKPMSPAEARIRLKPAAYQEALASRQVDASATRAALGVTLRFPEVLKGCERLWIREKQEILGLIPKDPT